MPSPLRPDLTRILPMPVLRRLAGREPPLAHAPTEAASSATPDFLVAVKPPAERDANAPGFGIAQARIVAARIAATWREAHADRAQRPDALRSQRLLAGDRD